MSSYIGKIGLGTVQWGLPYGVSNGEGKTTSDEVGLILSTAKSVGIHILDTAALYGEAEELLGTFDLSKFCVVTKTPNYLHMPISIEDTVDLVETFYRSLCRLHLPSVYGLLVHNADNILGVGGELMLESLIGLRDSGLVQRIGVSIYEGWQIERLLELFVPDIIQLPLNVFDQRLIVDGSLKRLASLGVEIHARSVFLQGLLLMPPTTIPPYFNPWSDRLHSWHEACAMHGLLPQHAALAFVCNLPEINYCLIGVQKQNQLNQLVTGLRTPSSLDYTPFLCADRELLNPTCWKI